MEDVKLNINLDNRILKLICTICLLLIPGIEAKQVVNIEPSEVDMTPVVRAALEKVSDSEVKLVFSKGTYTFRPDFAAEKYCFITNHDNGLKKIAFLFEGLDSVEIEGNGAELIFHGQIFPFQFEKCGKVSVKNLTIDWDIPFTFQGEVVAVNKKKGSRDNATNLSAYWTNLRPDYV